jgi:hypothetical protein
MTTNVQRILGIAAVLLGWAASAQAAGCDLSGDALTNVADVQLCVNQAIGMAACTTGDIDGTGACNVVDVQRVANAALGGSCVTGGSSGSRCPAFPAFPDATCTGVPAGTALTVVTGNKTYSTNGQVISGLDMHGKVVINADNVTLKNSIIRGPAAGGCSNGAAIETNGTGIVIQDVEVLMENPTACLDGVWTFGSSVTIRGANIHGGVDGVKTGSDILIEESYIHGMQWFASDPNQGGGETHNDGVQTFAAERNITLRHNRIDLSTTNNSNSAWQDSGYNSRAEQNYLDGGGCTLNFAAQSLGGATLQPMYVNNNHFGRHQGFTGCVSLISLKTVMTEYNGNVWQDTGLPVPPPQQHD